MKCRFGNDGAAIARLAQMTSIEQMTLNKIGYCLSEGIVGNLA